MKPWQKIALTIVLSLAVFSLVIIVGIFSLLPNPATFGERLKRGPEVTVSLADTEAPTAPITNEQKPTPPAIAPSAARHSAPKSAADKDSKRKKLVSDKFIDRYMTYDRIQSRVCENLGTGVRPFKNVEEFSSQLESSLLGETPPSATAEAVMLPIEYTLKNDAVRELVDIAKNAADRGDTGFVQKAQFYAQAVRATASIMSSRNELEVISADSYQLYALARAAALKPEIIEDAEMGDLCRGIERSAVDGLNRDRAFDRDRMSRLIAKHGITNESIGYDPLMSTRLSVVSTEGGLHVRMPWLESIFKTSSKSSR
jgi:hypothetical protein